MRAPVSMCISLRDISVYVGVRASVRACVLACEVYRCVCVCVCVKGMKVQGIK